MFAPFDDPTPADTPGEHDAPRIAPYLLRFYISVSNPHARVLNEDILDTLIGQIIWPRGALGRATAASKRNGPADRRTLPTFLKEAKRDRESVDLAVIPTHAVDLRLSQLGDFKCALKQLYDDDPEWLRGVLRSSLPAAEARQNEADGVMWTRLQQVGAVFGWTQVELQLARIAMHAADIAELAEWLDTLPAIGRDAARAYKRVLNADVRSLRQSLQPNSRLNCSGLFIVDRPHDHPLGLSDPPRLHPKLMEALGKADFHVNQLSQFLFSKSPGSTLIDADFAHLKTEYEPLGTLLQRATERQERGINILIYGSPGTGKTEFARWLTSHANLCSFEVPVIDNEDEDGSTHPVSDRIALLRSAHWLMRSATQTALIFDEAEDAFPQDAPLWIGGHSTRGAMQGPRKGWVNQLLEQTPLPTIWISNAVHQMDPAYLRRFTYHLEMRSPSQRVRERIAGLRAAAHGLPASMATLLGAFADASPAMIDSALRFARLASKDDNPETRANTQSQLATRSLRAGLQAAGRSGSLCQDNKPRELSETMAG